MKEIGALLKQKRESQRLSLEAVQRKTRIPLKYLEALEEGEFSRFPAEVYMAGSLRNYAQFLGLNGQELLDSYRRKLTEQKQVKEEPKAVRKKHEPSLRIVPVIAAIVVLFATAYFLARLQYGRMYTPPAAAPVISSTAPAGGVSPGVAVSSASPQSATGQPREKVLTLKVRMKDTSWLKITADEKPVFEGILPTGETREWSAHSGFSVSVGYVPGVELSLNGRSIDATRGATRDINQLNLGWKDAAS